MSAEPSVRPGAFAFHGPIALALVALAIGAHLPAVQPGFLRYADDRQIEENFMISSGFTAEGLRWAATTTWSGSWQPLTWLSHMADFQLFGDDARGHHATSLLLHAASVLLLFLGLRAATGATPRAALAAGLFAVHPLQAEPVAWLAQRGVLLAFALGLACLLAHGRWVLSGSRVARAGALLAFAASLAAGPALLALPLLLPLSARWPLRTSPAERARARRGLPFAVLALPVAAFALWVSAADATRDAQLAPHLADLGVEPARTLGAWLWPAGIGVLRDFPQDASAGVTLGAALLWVGLTALVATGRDRAPWAFAGLVGFGVLLAPALLLGERGITAHEAYAPAAALATATAWAAAEGLAWLSAPRVLRAVSGVAVLALLTVLCHAQSRTWRDHAALFAQALRVLPDDPTAHTELGIALAERGELGAALHQYDTALQLRPGDAYARANRGWALTLSGEPAAGIAELRRALQDEPALVDGAFYLAISLERAGRLDEAIEWHVEQLGLDPMHHGSLLHLAGLRAAHPDASLRDGAEAVRLCNRACALGGCDKAWELDVFGMALMEAGRPDKAIALAQRALQAARHEGDAALAESIAARLHGYAIGRPYRLTKRLAKGRAAGDLP